MSAGEANQVEPERLFIGNYNTDTQGASRVEH